MAAPNNVKQPFPYNVFWFVFTMIEGIFSVGRSILIYCSWKEVGLFLLSIFRLSLHIIKKKNLPRLCLCPYWCEKNGQHLPSHYCFLLCVYLESRLFFLGVAIFHCCTGSTFLPVTFHPFRGRVKSFNQFLKLNQV